MGRTANPSFFASIFHFSFKPDCHLFVGAPFLLQIFYAPARAGFRRRLSEATARFSSFFPLRIACPHGLRSVFGKDLQEALSGQRLALSSPFRILDGEAADRTYVQRRDAQMPSAQKAGSAVGSVNFRRLVLGCIKMKIPEKCFVFLNSTFFEISLLSNDAPVET